MRHSFKREWPFLIQQIKIGKKILINVSSNAEDVCGDLYNEKGKVNLFNYSVTILTKECAGENSIHADWPWRWKVSFAIKNRWADTIKQFAKHII